MSVATLSLFRNPLHVVHSVALLVLAARAAFQIALEYIPLLPKLEQMMELIAPMSTVASLCGVSMVLLTVRYPLTTPLLTDQTGPMAVRSHRRTANPQLYA